MTSSPPSPSPGPTDEFLIPEADPGARISRRRAEFWQISWLVSLSSLLVSLYAVFLSQRLAPVASQADLDRAAIMLARELSSLSVKHSRLGNIALCAGAGNNFELNSLQATLRLDALVAKRLCLKEVEEQIEKDAKELALLVNELCRLEHDLAKTDGPSASSSGRQSFAESVRKLLMHTGAGSRLRSLKIKLGAASTNSLGAETPLPLIEEESRKAHALGENYRTQIPVRIVGDIDYKFYELASSPRIIPGEFFRPLPENQLASVIMLEAEFEIPDRQQRSKIQTLRSCAIAGGSSQNNGQASLLMLSFPGGYLSSISSISDLLQAGTYENKDGEWLQAAGGEVPGEGHLVELARNGSGLKAHQAARNLLYCFMLAAGPRLVPENLEVLLKKPLAALVPRTDSQKPVTFNSGLFKDTGAASFAISMQSQRGASGQRILANAFSGKSFAQVAPPFTFPLYVSRSGLLSLPQDPGFDSNLLKDFLKSLHKTNIAGIESMQIANTVLFRMKNSIEQSDRSLSLLAEEIQSGKRSLEFLSNKNNDQNQDMKLKQISNQLTALMLQEQKTEEDKDRYLKIKSRALNALSKAREAARSSYEIASNLTRFAGQGLKRVTAPYKAFLLDRNLLFIPHEIPLDEDDLYELKQQSDSQEQDSQAQSWLTDDFRVTDIAEPGIFVDSKPILEYWQKGELKQENKPLYVFLPSKELISKKKELKLYASTSTPFDNGGINRHQLCYFNSQCIESGSRVRVGWSVLMRNLVFSYLNGGGQPLKSISPRWCHELGLHEENCPGLAAEIQIRTPVPRLGKEFSTINIQDPDGGPAISLYPPLPPELL